MTISDYCQQWTALRQHSHESLSQALLSILWDTQAGVLLLGHVLGSVFTAFRNLHAVFHAATNFHSHGVQGSAFSPSPTLAFFPLPSTCTYLDPGPDRQHGSFTKPKPLSSLRGTSLKHKKRATLQRCLHLQVGCSEENAAARCRPAVLRHHGNVLTDFPV